MLKSKAFWFSLALPTAYLLMGYFAGPRLVQPRLEQYVASLLGRELEFERLRVDPLTWSVQLDAVYLLAGEQSLWPGLAISAGKVDLRFSFWRLSPVVSALTMQAPRLVLDHANEQSLADPYPFVGLWQQWQEGGRAVVEQQPVPIERWRVEAGQVLIPTVGSPAGAEILLDNISLQADPQDPNGSREYSLAFSLAGNVDIESRGLYRSETLTARGQYQLQMAPATDGSMAELQAAGEFSGEFLADAMRIDLTESQLHSNRFASCMLDGLLCSVIMPLEAGFDSSLLAASDGIRVLQANARLSAFQLDASLGQGRLEFADQQDFDSAQIELGLPPAGSLDSAEQGVDRNFAIQLNAADNDHYQIEGQLDLVSHAVDARFAVSGQQDISGNTQLRSVARQPAQAAHSRLDVQLENPAASLAQEFIDENFTAGLTSTTLQLQLAASLDDLGLRLQENIILAQTALVPDSGPDSSAILDTEWLLALLRDPDGVLQFEIPELTIDSATDTSIREMVEQQTLAVLTQLSALPFAGLAKALNVSNQNLHEIRFAPGSAALNVASTETLADLAGILLQRPGLGIAVAGAYDPLLDKQALQAEQVRTHIALAMAADLAFRTGAEPPDFNEPIVQSVIDEFARRRVPPNVMREFADQFGHADADQGVLPEGDVTAYYSSLFELLVDHAEIPQGAMNTLARYRAQAVIDALEDAGVLRERLEAAAQADRSEAPVDGIPLPLQLFSIRGSTAEGAVPEGAGAGDTEGRE